MAGGTEDGAQQHASTDLVALIRGEFAALKMSFKAEFQDYMSEALKPLTDKLEGLTLSVTQTAQKADKAFDLSTAALSEIKTLHIGEDALFERIAILDHSQRQNNLKIRGLPEEVGGDMDLPDFVSDWLAAELRLNPSSSIVITKAYRLGAKVNPRRVGPRDVLITLLNVRWKRRILAEARQRRHFNYKSSKILIFPDLSREALQKRHELKPITSVLYANGLKFRWLTPLKISFTHQGKLHQISDEKGGRQLLQSLRLNLPADEEMAEDKKAAKRKSFTPESPVKSGKISARN